METVVTIILVIVAVIAIAAGVLWARRRALKNRFGPEYDRVVSEQDSRSAAERELRARERRHAELELTPLDPQARQRYADSWRDIQARFVEEPAQAVSAADELVTRLVAERGYPTDDRDEQLAHLSVDHARTLGHYRDAHEINQRNQRGEASTEQLRQAVVHYRALFDELLGAEPAPDAVRRGPGDAPEAGATDRGPDPDPAAAETQGPAGEPARDAGVPAGDAQDTTRR